MRWQDEWHCRRRGGEGQRVSCNLPVDTRWKISGYSCTCIFIQINTTSVFWNTKQKKGKNTELHTIFITSCPRAHIAFIFLSKLHNLRHKGHMYLQHTFLWSQKWKCCRKPKLFKVMEKEKIQDWNILKKQKQKEKKTDKTLCSQHGRCTEKWPQADTI